MLCNDFECISDVNSYYKKVYEIDFAFRIMPYSLSKTFYLTMLLLYSGVLAIITKETVKYDASDTPFMSVVRTRNIGKSPDYCYAVYIGVGLFCSKESDPSLLCRLFVEIYRYCIS